MNIKRWAARGDTISTVKVMNYGPDAGRKLTQILDFQAACAEGNKLIMQGNWEVTKCGKCNGDVVGGKCVCDV